MSSNLPDAALAGSSGSAREPLAMAIRSALPDLTTVSAMRGSLILPTVMTGIFTTFFTSAAISVISA